MSSYGTSNEVERGTMQTITKLGVSILLVVIMLIFSFYEESVFMSVLLGTPARVLSSLAFTAIVCVVLACGMGESFLLRSRAGLGLSMWVFLPWTTITAVIFFLALGLGVDNMVLITIMFYREDKTLPLEKRIVRGGGGVRVQ